MDDSISLADMCQRILQLDSQMRSARFINGRGHLLEGGMKGGLHSLESQKQDEMMFTELALRVRMRHEFDAEFGNVRFSISYRDKVVLLSFPLHDGGDVCLVSCERDLDFRQLAFDILEIIQPLTLPSES